MGDPFRHVRENEPFRPSAAAWNSFVDNTIESRKRQEGNRGIEFGRYRPWVDVYNASQHDFERFDAIGINGPVIDPTENLEEFENNLTFEGTVPRTCHVGKSGICLEAIPAGGWGRVLLSGVVQCWVDFGDYGDGLGFADVVSGSTALQAGYTGSAQILWADGRTGTQRAIVRLSNNPDALLTSICSSSSFGTSETSTSATSSTQTSESTSVATSEQSSSQTSQSTSELSSSEATSSSGTSQSSSPLTSESSSGGSSSQTSQSTSVTSSQDTSTSAASSSQTSESSSAVTSTTSSESATSSGGSSSGISESSSSPVCVAGVGGVAWSQIPIANSAEYLLGVDSYGCLVRVPASLCCSGLGSSSDSLLDSVTFSEGQD